MSFNNWQWIESSVWIYGSGTLFSQLIIVWFFSVSFVALPIFTTKISVLMVIFHHSLWLQFYLIIQLILSIFFQHLDWFVSVQKMIYLNKSINVSLLFHRIQAFTFSFKCRQKFLHRKSFFYFACLNFTLPCFILLYVAFRALWIIHVVNGIIVI